MQDRQHKRSLSNIFVRNMIIIVMVIIVIFILYEIFIVYSQMESVLKKNIELSGVQIARHLKNILLSGDSTINENKVNSVFLRKVVMIKKDFNLVKLRLFNSSGAILYSTDNKEIGEINTKDYFKNTVASGKLYSRIARKYRETADGDTINVDVAEIYVPVMVENRFQGAFELYYDITDRLAAVKNYFFHIYADIGLVILISSFCVFILLKRVVRLVKKHDEIYNLLSVSEKKYMGLITNIPGMVYRGRPDWTTEIISSSEELFGYTEEDLTSGRTKWSDIIYTEDRETVFKNALDLKKKPCHICQEYRIIDKNGNIRWVADYKRSLFNSNREFTGVDGIVFDITASKKAETDLHISEKKFRILFETSRDAYMTLEPPDWKFTSGNSAAIEMFNAVDETDFCAHSPWEFSPEFQPDGKSSYQKAGEMIREAMDTGHNFFEWTHRRLGGDDFPATVLLTRVTISGRNFLQATVRDISEIKQKEQQLVHSAKLAAVGQLASGIAHEFNNILAINMVNAQLLSDLLKKSPGEIENKETALRNIKKSINRGKTIVANMMAVTRPRSVKTDIVAIEKIIDNAFNLQLHQMELENIEIVKKYNSCRKVSIDTAQLEQVFMNLIINARHAIKPKGSGKITVAVSDKKDQVEITFADTGSGMSEEIKQKIFTPFFTTKGARASDSFGIKGTGLGLSVSHTIITNHYGTIRVDSREDEGTVFTINLPAAVAENEETAIISSETEHTDILRDKSLLIIDDEDLFLNPVSELFKQYKPKNVFIAQTGKKAIEIIKSQPVDIVFLDMVLPDMSGGQIFHEIKKINPDIPVILISGQVTLEADGMRKIGAAGFIQKPFEIKDVLKIISKIDFK